MKAPTLGGDRPRRKRHQPDRHTPRCFLLIAVGLIKFRRFLNLHLYTAKASGVFGALFVMDALAFGFHQ